MNMEDIRLDSIKYKVTKFEIIIPGLKEPYVIDDAHLGNFTIEKEYDKCVFPYMEFRVVVPDSIYRSIMDTAENVWVDLKIQYAHFNDFYEIDPEQSRSMFGTICDNRFYAFIANRSPKVSDSVLGERNKEKESDGLLTQYQFDNDHEIIMMLYRADHIFNTDQVINAVLHDATSTDAMVYYFKHLGLSNILMSPAQIQTRHNQLILPPIPAIGGMRKMMLTYGIHTAGTTLFFDYDFIYVLDKALGCTAWINNEIKTVYLTSFPTKGGDNAIMRSGFYANGKERYCVINVVGDNISVQNDAMFQDQLFGGNIAMIDSRTGDVAQRTMNLDVADTSPSKKGTINQVLVVDSGIDMTKTIQTAMEHSQYNFSINVQEVNIRALSPNKDFIFTTDNDKYRKYCGHYRITSMGATFTKESSLYTSMITATFTGGKATL